MISSLSNSLKAALNRANLATLPSAFKQMALGDIIRNLPTMLWSQVALAATVNPYVSASAQSLALPEDAKASCLFMAYARTGTGTAGPLILDTALEATAAAGHVGISYNGDILLAAADAWTAVDIHYLPQRADVVEVVVPVTPGTGAFTLPTVVNGNPAVYLTLQEAEVLSGTLKGAKIVGVGAATAPATTIVNLNLDKTGGHFAVADAVTSARLKLGVQPAVNLNALLEAASAFI